MGESRELQDNPPALMMMIDVGAFLLSKKSINLSYKNFAIREWGGPRLSLNFFSNPFFDLFLSGKRRPLEGVRGPSSNGKSILFFDLV